MSANWITCSLHELLRTLESGSRPKGGASEDTGEIASLGGENILQSGGVKLDYVKRVPRRYFMNMKKGVLQDQDVLINKDGANTGKLGLYCESPEFMTGCVNEHIFLMRAFPERLLQAYLYYLLLDEKTQQHIKNRISGSAQQGLNSRFTKDFFVRIPSSVPEQFLIASILSTVDKAIEQTEAMIAKQERIKTGLMQDLLTKGIDEHGNIRSEDTHKFKGSPLGRIPKEWGVLTCSQLCREIVVGIVIRPAQYYCPVGVPMIRSANIKENVIVMDDLVFMSADANRLLRKSMLAMGDLVTVRTGYPGTTAVVTEDVAGSNCVDVIISRPSTRIRSKYLALWINSQFGKAQVLGAQGGLAQQHFNVGEMKLLLVRVPTVDEQARIEAVVAAQEALSNELSSSVDKLKQLRRGLMQDLLSGNVPVTHLLKQTDSTMVENLACPA